MLTLENIKDILNYNPETGFLTWKVTLSNRSKKWSIAGSLVTDKGKTRYFIRAYGNKIEANKCAWAFIYGYIPDFQISHIDGNCSNLKKSNLTTFKNKDIELTQDYLKSILKYDHETGIFTWISASHKCCSNICIGEEAGSNHDKKGRKKIKINGVSYFYHRLAWLYVYGKFPKNLIDHLNNDPSDNRIANLREANHSQNMQNQKTSHSTSSTKIIGVWFNKQCNKYTSQITFNKNKIHLGLFDTAEDASKAYITAKRQLHEFNTI